MKSVIVSAMVVCGLVVSAPAFANKDLATKNGCMACHKVDAKLVGPAFQDVAKRLQANSPAMGEARYRTITGISTKRKAGGCWGICATGQI